MRTLPLFTVLVLLALAAFLASLLTGSIDTGWRDLYTVISGEAQELGTRVILDLRWPRAAAAFVAGALLALAGGLLQVLLRNPLADPYVLGVSGGAATGALLTLLLGLGGYWLPGAAFGGALSSMLLVFGLSHGHGSWSMNRLLLTGVVIAAGWSAVIGFLLALSPEQNLRGMLFWLMGDLSHADTPVAGFMVLSAGITAALLLGRSLNVLVHGELTAGTLGVSVATLRRTVYVLASVFTATAVTIAGTVGFVGLIVPHMLRLLGIRDHRILLPASALLGGTLLLVADLLARTLLEPRQLPVGILTALVGVPVFLYLLYRGDGRVREQSGREA